MNPLRRSLLHSCCYQALSVCWRGTTLVYWQVAVGYLEYSWNYCAFTIWSDDANIYPNVILFCLIFILRKWLLWSLPKKVGFNWTRVELCGWFLVSRSTSSWLTTFTDTEGLCLGHWFCMVAAKNCDKHAWQHAFRDVWIFYTTYPVSIHIKLPRQLAAHRLGLPATSTGPHIYIYIYIYI